MHLVVRVQVFGYPDLTPVDSRTVPLYDPDGSLVRGSVGKHQGMVPVFALASYPGQGWIFSSEQHQPWSAASAITSVVGFKIKCVQVLQKEHHLTS